MNELNDGLGWGKPTLNIGKRGAAGSAPASYKRIPTPVENSTKLTPTKGNKMEAKIEGGENEAVKYKASTYVLEFEIRKTAAKDMPVEDFDGVVSGEYLIQLIPEDVAAQGFIIDRASASVEDTFDAENGAKLKFTFDVLKPASGKQVKWGTQVDKCPPVSVTPISLSFTSAADTTGQKLTVIAAGDLTAATVTGTGFTVTKVGKEATVKASANSGSDARTGTVTLTADGKTIAVTVTQAGTVT